MPYRIDIVVKGQQKKSPTSPKKPGTTNIPTKPSEVINQLKSAGYVKTAIATKMAYDLGTAALTKVGEYTENQLQQNRINKALTLGASAVAIASNPVLGSIAVATNLGLKAIDERIQMRNANKRSRYLRELTGNTVNTGNRWRGQRG